MTIHFYGIRHLARSPHRNHLTQINENTQECNMVRDNAIEHSSMIATKSTNNSSVASGEFKLDTPPAERVVVIAILAPHIV